MFDLTGKTALITGASGGIGGAVAKALHAQGAIVTISGTNAEKLAALAASLVSRPRNDLHEFRGRKDTSLMNECHVYPGNDESHFLDMTLGNERIHILPCNLADAESVKQLAAKAEEAMGQVDILVNNAGITRDQLAMRMSDEDWQSVLQINLTSAFVLIRALLRGMMKRRYGRIISITSVVGSMGNPGQANYAASKAGLMGMTKSVAAEVASRGITANCVAPGFIATAMTDKLNGAQKQAITGNIPAGALGAPEDVSGAVAFLASEEARYITGQTIHVNGGMLML